MRKKRGKKRRTVIEGVIFMEEKFVQEAIYFFDWRLSFSDLITAQKKILIL